jgi:sRNA-binding carbon storage regulator CsrA
LGAEGDAVFIFGGKSGEGTLLTMPDGTMCRVLIVKRKGGKLEIGIEAPQSIRFKRFTEVNTNRNERVVEK